MKQFSILHLIGLMSRALVLLLITCLTVMAQSSDSWEYPIRFGDPLSKVHSLLGNATRTTDVLEEHPLSGVTVWFDSDRRVTKLNFQGAAFRSAFRVFG